LVRLKTYLVAATSTHHDEKPVPLFEAPQSLATVLSGITELAGTSPLDKLHTTVPTRFERQCGPSPTEKGALDNTDGAGFGVHPLVNPSGIFWRTHRTLSDIYLEGEADERTLDELRSKNIHSEDTTADSGRKPVQEVFLSADQVIICGTCVSVGYNNPARPHWWGLCPRGGSL
jgi:hypothetical protein